MSRLKASARNKTAILFLGLGALGVVLPLFGDENLKVPTSSTTTEKFDFAPGGLIRVSGSDGDLYVEAWDQPEVEVTVRKFLPYGFEPAHPELSTQHLEAVKVTTQKSSAAELAISTEFPPRKSFLRRLESPSKTGHVRLEYQVYVPRNSRLVITHGVGLVSVTGVTGDIEATCHRGDIMLWVPDGGMYSIDAKNKLGKVSSDFAGASVSRFLVGQKFDGPKSERSQRLFLRMGFGGITIKPILSESEARTTH